MSDRRQHLEWCKARACEYLNVGDPALAMSSFASDMRKHHGTAETMQNPAIAILTGFALMSAAQNDVAAVRSYIEGFS